MGLNLLYLQVWLVSGCVSRKANYYLLSLGDITAGVLNQQNVFLMKLIARDDCRNTRLAYLRQLM
jgi:hypothetical protein